MVFCKASAKSANGVKDVLDSFKLCSGLSFNSAKSSIIFSGNNSGDRKQEILSILSMPEGTLPIKYLGLPLIPARLSSHHCARSHSGKNAS